MRAPATIVCVDCGGRCGLLSHPDPDEGFRRGDVVAYRCADCLDRWDVVITSDDLLPDDDEAATTTSRRRRRGGNRSG